MKKYTYNDILLKNNPKSGKLKMLNSNSSNGKKKKIAALSVADFERYRKKCKKAHVDFAVVGKTKLKLLKKNSSGKSYATKDSDAVFEFENEYYEVRRDYKFCHPVAYIPVEKNEFIAVERISPWFLLLLLLFVCLLFGTSYVAIQNSSINSPTENPYVEEIDVPDTNPATSGGTRYIMNASITIIKTDQGDSIQNLGLENHNEGKVLRLKFKKNENDEEYIYDSGPVKYGEKIVADWLHTYVGDKSNLTTIDVGEYDTIAECYVYSADTNELITQTNFEITLSVQTN